MKRNRRLTLTLGLVVLAVCGWVIFRYSAVYAQSKPQSLSADTTFTDGTDAKPETGKIFVSWPVIRMDFDRQNMSSITNYSTKTSYYLWHQQRTYVEKAAPEYTLNAPDPCLKRPDITCKKIGVETVNGRVCDKWLTTDKSGATGTLWIDRKLSFPVKGHHPNGTTMDYTNIKPGPQAASLFEIPAGYQKVDIFPKTTQPAR